MPGFNPTQPYNTLPTLLPKQGLETRAIWKLCTEARVALAKLKQVGKLIPNQPVLINTIPLLEAQASSEIENIAPTSDQLFRFADTGANNSVNQTDPAIKEALRYRTTLYQGFPALQKCPLNTNLAVELCRTIKGSDLDIRRVPGTTLANNRTGKVIYTPPAGEATLRQLLANWGQFLHNHDETGSLAWPWHIINSKPSIPLLMTMAVLADCLIFSIWWIKNCSLLNSRSYNFLLRRSARLL